MIGRPGLDLHGLNALSGLAHCLAPPPAGKGCKKKLFCIRQNVSNLNLKFIEPEMEEKRREEGGGGRNPVFVKDRKLKKCVLVHQSRDKSYHANLNVTVQGCI